MSDGGYAFPTSSSTGNPLDGVYVQNGMTMRDYFAAAALTGLLANPHEIRSDSNNPFIAAEAWLIADAVLAKRNQ